MTTSSEDVLLQMGEVRYKKGDGTLYVMNERLAWMAENRDTVAVSHRFADIKMQKISPEGKPKVQLQVVLHDGNSSTFHFVNRNGQQEMLKDRDKVKELLQQLLPNFKRKVDKELEEKNRILSENPKLLQLYKDLVISKVVTSEEFWANHAKDLEKKTVTVKQDIGVSGAFLVDIKPQTDGCNGLKYNLTADIIQSIFKTYPAVKKKHQENVPSKLSEPEFWTKFFQSHYFHRDRITAGTKDIFSECGKIDDQMLKSAIQRGPENPFLDLKKFEDVPLEEGFGSASVNSSNSSNNIVHQNMIKRFNQHSIMVLKTCTDTNGPSTSTASINSASTSSAAALEGVSNGINGGTHKSKHKKGNEIILNGHRESENTTEDVLSKRKRVLEKINYDDLGVPEIAVDGQVSAKNDAFINFSNVERYLHGLVPNNSQQSYDDPRRLEEVQYSLKRVASTFIAHRSRSLMSPTAAINALGELSPGGAIMRAFQDQSVGQLVPPDFERDLRNIYLSFQELLRFFWSNFPPNSIEQEEAVVQHHEALQRFKQAKLVPFENRAIRALSPLGSSITQHINVMLKSVNTKFAAWQGRKIRKYR
ncbi:general transcription factor IIH subunit 1-like isoform X2 [Teleopsis dalmanni]|nr:general transcription factor IIH subunit 1-like isoform X2 [Teleopsis dalmanni]XP_037952311.1 general transcription factor IIH subunit 1-like isoform X2 [Teleopsis dalmanni]